MRWQPWPLQAAASHPHTGTNTRIKRRAGSGVNRHVRLAWMSAGLSGSYLQSVVVVTWHDKSFLEALLCRLPPSSTMGTAHSWHLYLNHVQWELTCTLLIKYAPDFEDLKNVMLYILCFFCFQDKFSLYSPGCPGPRYVDQTVWTHGVHTFCLSHMLLLRCIQIVTFVSCFLAFFLSHFPQYTLSSFFSLFFFYHLKGLVLNLYFGYYRSAVNISVHIFMETYIFYLGMVNTLEQNYWATE